MSLLIETSLQQYSGKRKKIYSCQDPRVLLCYNLCAMRGAILTMANKVWLYFLELKNIMMGLVCQEAIWRLLCMAQA